MKINSIKLTKKAETATLTEQQAKIVAAISKGVNLFSVLKTRTCRSMSAKRLRSQLRKLSAARVISVTRVSRKSPLHA